MVTLDRETFKGGETYTAACAEGLLTVRHYGAFTGAIWRRTAEALNADFPGAVALLVDLRTAIVLLDIDDLARRVAAAGPCSPLERASLPGAIVVSEAIAEPVRRYCWALAQHGVMRVPFTDLDRAASWAQREVEWRTAPFLPQPPRPPGGQATSARRRVALARASRARRPAGRGR